jgi:hypothetical protein
MVRDFKQAWEAKDIDTLIGLLDPDATLTGDGGGLAPAALRPIEGGEQVARYLADLARAAPGNVVFLERTVNGQPGLVAHQDGVTVAVYAFEIAGDQITRIWAILNPRQAPALGQRLTRMPMPSTRCRLPPPASPAHPTKIHNRGNQRRRAYLNLCLSEFVLPHVT